MNELNPLKKMCQLDFKVLRLTSIFPLYSIHSSIIDYRYRTRALKSQHLEESDDESFSNEMDFTSEADLFFGDEDSNVPDQVEMKKADIMSEKILRNISA